MSHRSGTDCEDDGKWYSESSCTHPEMLLETKNEVAWALLAMSMYEYHVKIVRFHGLRWDFAASGIPMYLHTVFYSFHWKCKRIIRTRNIVDAQIIWFLKQRCQEITFRSLQR
jgi:hypothetical protein